MNNEQKKEGFLVNIEKESLENDCFRKVLFTTDRTQLVVMALMPEEEIGMEIHETADQFFRIEAGKGVLILSGKRYPVKDGDSMVVPAGAEHNLINNSEDEILKLYTIYSPPQHPDKTMHVTKADALKEEK